MQREVRSEWLLPSGWSTIDHCRYADTKEKGAPLFLLPFPILLFCGNCGKDGKGLRSKQTARFFPLINVHLLDDKKALFIYLASFQE